MTDRTMPEGLSDERSLLDGWLDYYRATLLAKCDGLTGQQLITRSCEPSPMSLIGPGQAHDGNGAGLRAPAGRLGH
jgi:Protein of unknown function (DUF664)